MLQRVVATGRGEVHSRDIRIARVDFVRARQPPLLIDRLPLDHIQQAVCSGMPRMTGLNF